MELFGCSPLIVRSHSFIIDTYRMVAVIAKLQYVNNNNNMGEYLIALPVCQIARNVHG